MEDKLKSLGKEIYYNYRGFLAKGQTFKICQAFIKRGDVSGFTHEDPNIAIVEKDKVTYINTNFAEIVYMFAYEELLLEEKLLSQVASMDVHTVHLFVFTYICLFSKQFIEDYKKIYDK